MASLPQLNEFGEALDGSELWRRGPSRASAQAAPTPPEKRGRCHLPEETTPPPVAVAWFIISVMMTVFSTSDAMYRDSSLYEPGVSLRYIFFEDRYSWFSWLNLLWVLANVVHSGLCVYTAVRFMMLNEDEDDSSGEQPSDATGARTQGKGTQGSGRRRRPTHKQMLMLHEIVAISWTLVVLFVWGMGSADVILFLVMMQALAVLKRSMAKYKGRPRIWRKGVRFILSWTSPSRIFLDAAGTIFVFLLSIVTEPHYLVFVSSFIVAVRVTFFVAKLPGLLDPIYAAMDMVIVRFMLLLLLWVWVMAVLGVFCFQRCEEMPQFKDIPEAYATAIQVMTFDSWNSIFTGWKDAKAELACTSDEVCPYWMAVAWIYLTAFTFGVLFLNLLIGILSESYSANKIERESLRAADESFEQIVLGKFSELQAQISELQARQTALLDLLASQGKIDGA